MCAIAIWFLGHRLPEGGEKRVFTGRLIGWVEREQCERPNVALMLHLGYATEEPGQQVMVYVVPWVPDGQNFEHMTVCPKDVVCPGTHLIEIMEHAPRLAIPIPRYFVVEEVIYHILHPSRQHHCLYHLVALVSVWRLHIYIEVYGNEELHTLGALDDRRNNALRGGGIMRREVASHHVPEAPTRHHLGDGDFQFMLWMGFQQKEQGIF